MEATFWGSKIFVGALPLMAHNVHKNMSIRKNMNKVFIRKA